LTDYYQILHLQHGAGLDEVKHAYRKLAHEYHPDVSKLPEARELFIALNEAYEYLLNKLKLEKALKDRNSTAYEETAQSIIDAWMASERERIRNRAKQHADMRFRKFRKTKIYRTAEILTKYLNIGTLLLGIVVFTVSMFGTWQQTHLYNRYNIDFSYIASAVIVGLLGICMILYSIYKIRSASNANDRH
jgi:curved DNA-binding protein CbpA